MQAVFTKERFIPSWVSGKRGVDEDDAQDNMKRQLIQMMGDSKSDDRIREFFQKNFDKQ